MRSCAWNLCPAADFPHYGYGGGQKEDWEGWHSVRMTDTLKPRIEQADRVDNGVVVSFEGGEVAFYSAELLYGMRASAVNLPDSEADEF